MATKMESRHKYCKRCKTHTVHHRSFKAVTFQENMGHGCLMVLTLGIWIPIWALWVIACGIMRANARYRCERCGK